MVANAWRYLTCLSSRDLSLSSVFYNFFTSVPWGQALQNAQAAKVDELQELHAARAIQRGWRGHKVKKVKQEEEVGSMAPSSVT